MSIHVTCGEGGAYSSGQLVPVEVGSLDWSETLVSAGTTTNTAGTDSPAYSRKILTVTAYGAPAWVAIGASPNAGANPRRYLADGQMIQVAVEPGDKVAWAVVT